MKHGEIANMWFCECICFSVLRRLSPLEEIHKQEWLQAEPPGSCMDKRSNGEGGCRVLRHVRWASGSAQGVNYSGGGVGVMS